MRPAAALASLTAAAVLHTAVPHAAGGPAPAGATNTRRTAAAAGSVPYGPPAPTAPLCPPDDAERAAARIVERLSVADQAAQTVFLTVYGSTGSGVTAEQRAANQALYGVGTPAEIVATIRPGGVSLIRRNRMDPPRAAVAADNLQTPAQIRALTDDLTTAAGDRGLLLAVDQEGGRASLLGTAVARPPAAVEVGARGDIGAAEAVARTIGASVRDLGIHVDWTPLADVVPPGTPPRSVIGDRAYGTDARLVTDMVLATMRGLAATDVEATAKHFPGHGYAWGDTHVRAVTLERTLDQLFAVELVPFVAAIRAGVPAIMLSHLLVPAMDPARQPASRSAAVVRFLRTTLGYCGLVVTDSLWMASVRAGMTDPEVAVAALAAGADVLLTPPDVRGAIAAVEAAVREGRLPAGRLRDAATEVMAMKVRRGLVAPGP